MVRTKTAAKSQKQQRRNLLGSFFSDIIPYMIEQEFIKKLEKKSIPLKNTEDLGPLLNSIGEASIVMLGEASHGTREYYLWRSHITKRLIEEKGFRFIAVEGDWPDCYEINRYIKGYTNEKDPSAKLIECFHRWPSWMWANEEVAELLKWLRDYNQNLHDPDKIGFYGLDVYSLWQSLETTIKYLKKNDKKLMESALDAYECFEPYLPDAQNYARAAAFNNESCEKEVVNLLADIRTKTNAYEKDPEGYFNAEQNALIVKNAEHYYRTMIQGSSASWNIRDKHMAETLERLLRLHGKNAKAIIWAHNTHIGDARATSMARAGVLNLGQLARERYPRKEVFLIGFSSYEGTVIAADEWGGPMKKKPVPEARRGSIEDYLHSINHSPDKLLIFRDEDNEDEDLITVRGHRAIGVVYHPQDEYHNYVSTVLPERYDAFIHIDSSSALHPLRIGHYENEEMPETYPSGF